MNRFDLLTVPSKSKAARESGLSQNQHIALSQPKSMENMFFCDLGGAVGRCFVIWEGLLEGVL